MCGRLGLLTAATVAIDGSRFKGVNAMDKNFTQGKIAKRLEKISESVEKYLLQLETADRQPATPEMKITRLRGKLDRLKLEMQRLNALGAQIAASGDKQISLTDPDARSMTSAGKKIGLVGYNVQCAVETKNHLIIAHEVINSGSDRAQLSNMAGQAREALGAATMEAVADRGYYTGEEILACEQAGVTVYVPKPLTSGATADGRFGKQDFVYDSEADVYLCPAGQQLTYRYTNEEGGKILRHYFTQTGICLACPLKDKCTPAKERRVNRWEHEAVLDAAQDRLDRNPAR